MNSGPSFDVYLNGNFGELDSALTHCFDNTSRRLSSTRATLLAIFCTTSEIFDVPVYWPILVIYFFVLFALTMRRQIQLVFFSPDALP